MDIEILNTSHVRMSKRLWHPAELVIAQCFNWHVDIDNGEITGSIVATDKKCFYDFIKLAFKSFSESVNEQNRRDSFYSELESIYTKIGNSVDEVCAVKLPYYNKFYVHQKEGIKFAFHNRCNFLAYQMRLGKSIISASLSRIFNIKRTIIICPAVAKFGWFRDLTSDTWGFNSLYFSLLDTSKSRQFLALQERFVIVNYDILEKNINYLTGSEVGHIIIDEAHKCKDRNSKRFKNVKKLVDHFPDARITMLSGTAIPNRFDDMFAYFKLTKHHLGESYKKFLDDFTVRSNIRGGERVTGAKNIADLRLKISNFMIVKTMDECFDMPEDIISRYTFEMDDYRDEYDKIILEMSQQKEISGLTGNIHSLNIITTKAKMKGMIEAIEDIVEETGKIVVFGTYKEPLQMLEDHFGSRCVKVVGGVSPFDRDRFKQQFWNDPHTQVFLANYEAGGEALDLSIASDFFTINFPLSPRELNQAKFRCKHPEKRKHIRIHHTFCENSIDEHIYNNIILNKEADINALLHGGKQVIQQENMVELLIKKILNKDDVVFKKPFQKKEEAKPLDGGPGTSEYSTSEELHTGDRSAGESIAVPLTEEKRQEGPKYYLMLHCESDSLMIYNQVEFDEYYSMPKSLELIKLVEHEDVQFIVSRGRHEQMRKRGSFDSKYTPNGTTITPEVLTKELTQAWESMPQKAEEPKINNFTPPLFL